MAEQVFTFFERRAFWEAHGKRCAYCREPLSFGQLQIDHIVPESLLKNEIEWARVRGEQGLPDDFDLRGYGNLQPCCSACNGRKLANPFPPGRTAIELGVASRARSKVQELVERFRQEDKKDKLRFAIAGAIESGALSEREIGGVISAARFNTGTFRLSATFQLFGDQPVGEISRADYERYLDMKLTLPSDSNEGLRLVSDNGQEARVSTLRQFQQATAKGFYPLTSFEMHVAYASFERPLAVLHVLRTAQLAERSFIDDPRLGLADISLLPATLLFVTEDITSDEAFAGQRAALEGRSIQDLVSRGEATIADVGSDLLAVEYDGGRTFMFEMMRADIDGDGTQDMLIHWGAGPIDGTLRIASAVVLARRSPDEMFSTLRVDAR